MVKKVGSYNLEQPIGAGQFGTVYFGRDRSSGKAIAAKSIDRTKLNSRLLKQMELEIKTMKQVQSEYIVKLYDVLMTTNNIYLIMEFCSGGDLENFIKKHGAVPEPIARKWISQMLAAFVTLQENHILHRDLKLANLLLTCDDPELADIKLADFGFARILNEQSMAQTQLGTPLFMAPEIFNREDYSYKVDVWSLGTLSYEIMTGRSAFNCATLVELKRMQREPVAFPEDSQLSDEAKDIVNRMLTYDSASRPSFEELQNHPFLRPVISDIQIPVQVEEAAEASGIHEVVEEDVDMSEFVIFGDPASPQAPPAESPPAPAIEPLVPVETASAGMTGLELSYMPSQLLDICVKIDEAQPFLESAKVYEQTNELMVAYAFYQKFQSLKATQMQRLTNLIRDNNISLHEDPVLSEMFTEIQLDLAAASEKLRELQDMLSQKVELMQSFLVFSDRDAFTFDENELLREAERVLGSIDSAQIVEMKEGYKRAEELLKIALEANPQNVRASALFSEVKEKHRQISV
jgi:serine/threonine protein kinase